MTRRETHDEVLTQAIVRYAVERIHMDPVPLNHARTEAELRLAAGGTITKDGLGGLEALRVFVDELAPACLSIDHPRYLAFVPCAPTEASVLFDLVVGASAVYGGSWLEGAGAVFAENEALRWVADLAGLPESAGGVFVSGGSAANLSALVTARYAWRERDLSRQRLRGLVITSDNVHSSIAASARVMDVDVVALPSDEAGRLPGEALRRGLEELPAEDRSRAFAVIATAGTTNAGTVDDLDGLATVAAEHELWFHVDGAYGGAALAAPSARHLFRGVERADSFCVDPHTWLFAPFDSAALLYRNPEIARQAHTQHAAYLAALAGDEWNPSDYAYHLTRRARGLPFWFSLASYGTEYYTDAIETTLALTKGAAELVRRCPFTELVLEPELSVVLFRRTGWGAAEYTAWSDDLLDAGVGLVVPSAWRGESVLRLCFVNPTTTLEDVQVILDSLE
jgi:glutamate/tyrosine decarboxylase-like PLP-dependent enzyme